MKRVWIFIIVGVALLVNTNNVSAREYLSHDWTSNRGDRSLVGVLFSDITDVYDGYIQTSLVQDGAHPIDVSAVIQRTREDGSTVVWENKIKGGLFLGTIAKYEDTIFVPFADFYGNSYIVKYDINGKEMGKYKLDVRHGEKIPFSYLDLIVNNDTLYVISQNVDENILGGTFDSNKIDVGLVPSQVFELNMQNGNVLNSHDFVSLSDADIEMITNGNSAILEKCFKLELVEDTTSADEKRAEVRVVTSKIYKNKDIYYTGVVLNLDLSNIFGENFVKIRGFVAKTDSNGSVIWSNFKENAIYYNSVFVGGHIVSPVMMVDPNSENFLISMVSVYDGLGNEVESHYLKDKTGIERAIVYKVDEVNGKVLFQTADADAIINLFSSLSKNITNFNGNTLDINYDDIPEIDLMAKTHIVNYAFNYGVRLADTSYGEVKMNESYKAGELVRLSVQPNRGYVLKSLRVYDEDNNLVEVNADHSFIMPASAIYVDANFVVDLDYNPKTGIVRHTFLFALLSLGCYIIYFKLRTIRVY